MAAFPAGGAAAAQSAGTGPPAGGTPSPPDCTSVPFTRVGTPEDF